MNEQLILINEQDQIIGQAEKMRVHQEGLLHRAFSVFVFRQNSSGQRELLLQQRQFDKYHSKGLWTNSCCGHPRFGEGTIEAGQRRLQEEMGLMIKLHEAGVFHYRVDLEGKMVENEMDHVLVGDYRNEMIDIDPDEVADYCWMKIDMLWQDLKKHPEKYTAWFAQALSLAVGIK
ncbi:MAG: isopentenyl-diphosphate Delta-isomerase [Gammaproteobacteria bacterium]